MTHTFEVIGKLIPSLHGWCTVDRATTMAAAVMALRPECSVEIGVWGGRGTLALALAHKAISSGYVVGIDAWSPQASVVDQIGDDLKWWASADHEMVYKDFLKQVDYFKLSEVVKVKRAKSDEVEPPKNIGVLVIDGNHGIQAERDAIRFAPNVQRGGLIFADDLHWTGGGVEKAVRVIVEIGFRKLYDINEGAVFQRL